jgi:Tfp pilus assembly protein PilV
VGRLKKLQAGFSVIETLLLIIIVGMLGGVGWYVWHANSQANKNLNAASSTEIAVPASKAIKTFEDCKKAASSKIQETFPEVCVTKSGQKFTDAVRKFVLDNNKVIVKVPASFLVVDNKLDDCRASVTSSVTENQDCLDAANFTISGAAQSNNPFILNMSVYTLKNKNATPQNWFENDFQGGQAVSAYGDIVSHESINGYTSYYYEQNNKIEEPYKDENFVIISNGLVVYFYSRLSHSNSSVPSSNFDYAKYLPDIKQLVNSIEIH